MLKNYEVEIKSLLISKENVDKLKKALQKEYPHMKLIGKGNQLNHYFNVPTDISFLTKKISSVIPKNRKKALIDILSHGKKISMRTRDADKNVILVIKASLGDDTSSNGVRRAEFECPVSKTLDELDQMLISTGCSYQAKWSREREEFFVDDMHVCIDRNAGYGYLAEFEKVISDESALEQTHEDLLKIMTKLGVSELPQDRLERMFAHYNANWSKYYGTDHTFIIE